MLSTSGLPAGFLAVSAVPGAYPPDVSQAIHLLGDASQSLAIGDINLTLCKIDARTVSSDGSVLASLSRAPRRHERDLDPVTVMKFLRDGDLAALQNVLPPFAAMTWGGQTRGLVAGVDPLGFRHLYYRRTEQWAAVSTSARVLASLQLSGIDPTAFGVQSLLGWQLGLRTPFFDVSKVPAGAIVTLHKGRVTIRDTENSTTISSEVQPNLNEAVRSAASLLRTYMSAYLEDHPHAVLQLTGGQDSRILLGAVPENRRRGLHVMTLDVPGNDDLEIAAMLAQRYGMKHQVINLEGLDAVSPEDAHDMAVVAAKRLECSADPIAWASVSWAEGEVQQYPRLSGLGGEVARGFYYLGPPRTVTVTRRRVQQLAEWRMFSNEAVASHSLEPAFATSARTVTIDEIYSILASDGYDWLTATDEFYLRQRMQRWAGILSTATCLERAVVNPMLDNRFLGLARCLRPREKHASRFLGRLMCALDDELSSIPLNGRPAPKAYAYPRRSRNRVSLGAVTVRTAAAKVRQRAMRARRPSVGGEILAKKISEFYRDSSGALDAVRNLGVFRSDWLDQVAAGTTSVDPASVAMLVNLEVASISQA